MTGCITNAYGIGERSERLICRTLQAIREGKEVFFTEGKQFYDFIYITDAAQAFAAIGQRGKAGKSYLVGSGHPRPLRAWMEELLEVSGGKGRFGAVPFTSARLEEADLSTTELETDTGFSCQIPFSAGIRKTMSWMEEDDVRFSF